jgi:hypothetical protein
MAVAHKPRVIEQLVDPAQVLLAIVLVVAILARLADRVRGPTRLGRRTLTPVLVVAMVWAIALAVTLAVRLAWPGSGFVEAVAWLVAFTVPAMAVAFLIGLMRWWVYIGASVRRLADRLRGTRLGPRSCGAHWRTRSRTRRSKSRTAMGTAGPMPRGERSPRPHPAPGDA